MSDLVRWCQRAGCVQPASVTLSFRYDARQASLVDLLPEKHPALYDICGAHADLLIVPRGWERLDRRTPAPLPEEVADVDAPAAGDDPRTDRYAALTAELPRLAEACGLTVPEGGPVASRVAAHAGGLPRAGDRAVPERASSAGGPAARGRAHLFEPVTEALLPDDVLEGQLQMPIESEPHGVVVALTRTRNS